MFRPALGTRVVLGALLGLLALVPSASVAQPSVSADSLLAASDSLAALGDFAGAERLARAALAELEAAHGSEDGAALDAAVTLGWVLVDQRRLDEAEATFERVLAGQEATGPDRPAVALALTDLATVLYYQGRYDRASRLTTRALALLERMPEPPAPDLIAALNLQALLAFTQGAFTHALGLYERALALTEETYGPDHEEVAAVLHNFAPVLHQLGDYARARQLYERALAIDEAVLGAGHPLIAEDLDQLAFLLADQGDLAAARRLYERSLRIKEAALAADDPRLARTLHNLAGVRVRQGEAAPARALYERALRAAEQLGPSHPEVARNLRSLAYLDREANPERAAERLERALASQEAQLGDTHPNVAETAADLARLALEAGAFDDAETLYRRAVAVWEASLGPDHPGLVRGLNGLALVAERRGAPDAAPLLRAGRLLRQHTRDVLPALALAEQQAFLSTVVPRQTALLLALANAEAERAPAYDLVAGWKGQLLHELRRQRAVLALAADTAHAGAVEQLQAVRADLAAWYRRAGVLPLAAWQARNDSLTATKERLERELAAALPAGVLADPWHEHGLDGLRAVMPAASALVDLHRHTAYPGGAATAPRYTAVVVTPSAGPVHVDLGPAQAIDTAVAAWREAVLEGHPAEAETDALTEALWRPVVAALPDGAERVWVSPDAQLARVPWAALASLHAPAAERLVAEVASPRALLRLLTTTRAPSEGALFVGDVEFGAGGAWEALPGTGREVRRIAALAEEEALAVTVLMGAAPTPARVGAGLRQARYAHLATHGFFFRETEGGYASRSGDPSEPTAAYAAAQRNPLVESGLALAGANTGPAGNLTAEELVGLDLDGTRLVTLSACDTGRGTEITGQGVMGLRASVEAAGARALLMSLWKVPDASTALLMETFYWGLWAEGLAPAEALRRAQEAVRSDPRYRAPVHWAAWTLSGDAF